MPLLLNGKSDQLLHRTQEKSSEGEEGSSLLSTDHDGVSAWSPILLLYLQLSHTPLVQASFTGVICTASQNIPCPPEMPSQPVEKFQVHKGYFLFEGDDDKPRSLGMTTLTAQVKSPAEQTPSHPAGRNSSSALQSEQDAAYWGVHLWLWGAGYGDGSSLPIS